MCGISLLEYRMWASKSIQKIWRLYNDPQLLPSLKEVTKLGEKFFHGH